MTLVALIVHTERPRAVALALDAVAWLQREGHEACLPADDAERIDRPDLACAGDRLGAEAGLAVSLGGDGTMLRAVHMVAGFGVPIMGVHVGHLGYLTEIEPSDMIGALGRFFSGQHRLEERMMLSAEVITAEGPGVTAHCALNEVVVEKMSPGHTVRLAVSIDGTPFITFAADGLIVATPTGSTAYALSARGPIVSPRHKALLLTPVSPHMLFDRTLVLDPDETVHIQVIGERAATLSVDGRSAGMLRSGDELSFSAAPRPALLVTFASRSFHGILKAKFGLSDR